jgi:hypothetical protein
VKPQVHNLEEKLDHLYSLEPAMFVAERDRLVRELRDEGQREEAEQVKHLRKPTVSAWTINQLARQERRDIDLLLDAGHRLIEAQQGLFAGEDRKSLDEARRTQRDALARLRQAARRILVAAGHGGEAVLDRIMGTLQAAAVSTEGRELLARGRLMGDIEATGFELLAPLAKGVPSTEKSKQRRSGPRAREAKVAQERERVEDQKRIEDARRQLREARANVKAAENDLNGARRDASKARRDLARAEERVQRSNTAAAEAHIALEHAEKQLREVQNG